MDSSVILVFQISAEIRFKIFIFHLPTNNFFLANNPVHAEKTRKGPSDNKE